MSLIVIESEIKDSPVEVVKGDKFRWAVSYQLCIRRLLSMETFTLPQRILNQLVTGIMFGFIIKSMSSIDQGLCDISQPNIITCSKGCAGTIHQLLPTNLIHIMLQIICKLKDLVPVHSMIQCSIPPFHSTDSRHPNLAVIHNALVIITAKLTAWV